MYPLICPHWQKGRARPEKSPGLNEEKGVARVLILSNDAPNSLASGEDDSTADHTFVTIR